MKIKTHILIANKIHDHLDSNYDNILNKRHFVFGNIKPDLFRKFKNKKHNMRDSLDFVLNEIKRYDYDSHNIDNQSVHIGMINHYLSDFFCSKHYFEEDKTRLIKHIRYEKKLHKVIKKLDFKKLLETSYTKLINDISGSFKDIIKALEYEYLKQPPSIENDILFALSAPLIACKYILKQNTLDNLASA